MKLLAVDHGMLRIGVAIGDTDARIARPLMVMKHVSLQKDAAVIAEQYRIHQAGRIVVGYSLDDAGNPTLAGKQAARFAETLQQDYLLPVILWDESLTTCDARAIRLLSDYPRKKRSGHLDDVAAAVLLQSFLDELLIRDKDT